MLRKALFGVGGLFVGYVLGAVVGFNKGIEYHQDKMAEKRNEQLFADRDEPAHINLTLESSE